MYKKIKETRVTLQEMYRVLYDKKTKQRFIENADERRVLNDLELIESAGADLHNLIWVEFRKDTREQSRSRPSSAASKTLRSSSSTKSAKYAAGGSIRDRKGK